MANIQGAAFIPSASIRSSSMARWLVHSFGILAMVLFSTAPVQASPSFLGTNLTASYLHDTTVIGSTDVTAAGAAFSNVSCPGAFAGPGICAAFGEATTIEFDADIGQILLNEGGGGFYSAFNFNGVVFSNLHFDDGSTLSGFKLSTDLAGLTDADIAFTGSSISFNAQGLDFSNAPYYIQLNLITSNTTPEPGTISLLAGAVFAAAMTRKKRALAHQ